MNEDSKKENIARLKELHLSNDAEIQDLLNQRLTRLALREKMTQKKEEKVMIWQPQDEQVGQEPQDEQVQVDPQDKQHDEPKVNNEAAWKIKLK